MPSAPPTQREPASDNGLTGFATSVSAVMVLVLLGKAMGFFEKMALAYFEGASASVDAYLAASSLAFFLFVLVDDILAPVFVAVYVQALRQQGDATARALFRRVFGFTVLVLLVALALMELFAGRLVSGLAPGFDAGQQGLTVRLLRWTLPGGLFLGLAGLTYVVLNAHRLFAWPELGRAVYKTLIVVFVLILVPGLGIAGAAIGACLAAAAQFAFHVVGMRRYTHSPEPDAHSAASTRKQTITLLKLMIPLAVGTLAAQFSGFVDVNRGSTLTRGSVAALGYARKLVDLPVLLVPAVLGVVALPRFAELAARNRLDELTRLLARLSTFCLVAFLPAMLVFLLSPESVVDLVFARGRFDEQAIALTSTALRYFSIGLLAYAVEILVLRAYYAMLDTTTPIVVGLVYVAVNIGMTIVLTPALGIVAIPLALSMQKTLKVITLLVIMARRMPGSWLRELGSGGWRGCLCGVAFCVVFGLARYLVSHMAGERQVGAFVMLLATAGPACIAYAMALVAVRLVELKTLMSSVRSAIANITGSSRQRH